LVKGTSGIYSFQMRVPADLLHHYEPKQLIKKSLRTRDLREAKRLAALEQANLLGEWARLRSLKTTISDSEIAHIVAAAVHSRLAADEDIRTAGVDDDMYEKMAIWVTETDAATRTAISRGALTDHAAELVDEWLHAHGYDLPPRVS
uniref:DUF6538 domain-containing protein n=1 Tax=Sphingobium sp. Ndbn-10 TaxID=1667223 RepID=UPI001BAE82CE